MICNGTITSQKVLAEINEVANAKFEEHRREAILSEDLLIASIKAPLDEKIEEVTNRIRYHFSDFFSTHSANFHSIVTIEEGNVTVSMSPDMQNFCRYIDQQLP